MSEKKATIARLKRYAVQIATQLPDNREDAMRVLDYARELVEWAEPEEGAQVVPFRSIG